MESRARNTQKETGKSVKNIREHATEKLAQITYVRQWFDHLPQTKDKNNTYTPIEF